MKVDCGFRIKGVPTVVFWREKVAVGDKLMDSKSGDVSINTGNSVFGKAGDIEIGGSQGFSTFGSSSWNHLGSVLH